MNRHDFPILKDLVYLDSAAAALKPRVVYEKLAHFYERYPLNVHNSDSPLGLEVVHQIEQLRRELGQLIEGQPSEIIFTSSTTDSLNKIARMLEPLVKSGDQILLSHYNHASQVTPWLELARRCQAKVVYAQNLDQAINSRTKIIAYAQLNNTLAWPTDVGKIWKKAQRVKAWVVNDVAQAIAHEPVTLKRAHVLAFSSNKLYGPAGIGVLAVQNDLLSQLQPVTFGGGSTKMVSGQTWQPTRGISRYEPGTPDHFGLLAFRVALDYFLKNRDFKAEQKLARYAYDQLSNLPGLTIYSQPEDVICLFNYQKFNAHDVVSYLARRNIILRGGNHCAPLAAGAHQVSSAIRLSIGGYNDQGDIDQLVNALKEGGDFLDELV